MISKFSVKKPFTVLVGVIMILVLGVVAYTKMSADLLPNINLPYVVIMTTDVGASPETVETVVTSPVESAMATVSNIEGIQSMSAENYSVVILEFSQTADMNSISLEIRENLDQLDSYWDDSVGNPVIMKINPDMLPIMIAAVGIEGMDEAEISRFTQDTLVPDIKSIEGVASVNATGLMEQSLHVVVREELVDKVNEKVGKEIDESLKDAKASIEDGLSQAEKNLSDLEGAFMAGLMDEASYDASKTQIEAAVKDLNNAKTELENTKESVLDGMNLKELISDDMVSGILSAQNFSMPAGYVNEGDDTYLVRIGDKPESLEDIKNLPILNLPVGDGVTVKLSEVADVFYTDNLENVYTNVDGKRGIILSLQKQTGYSTGDVADSINSKFDDLMEEFDGLSLVPLMDQGIYIDLVMSTIIENVLIGAILAILILIVFLRDIRPTLVIAISIPVSLIAAVVCMYFSGVTLNIISLSGLALGVGMLVDNSIVVIENIYRMRNEGKDPVTAAIEGAKEVAGAIAASTLTTVCVFLPIVFTEGITRQLFVDMGLTIAFSLLASLVVALTVVPAMAAGTLRKIKVTNKSQNKGFYPVYAKFLKGCLKVKPLIILLAIGLLVLSAYFEAKRGTEYFPEMASTQVTVTLSATKDSKLKDVKNETNEYVDRVLKLEDVENIGAMAAQTGLAIFGAQSTEADLTSTTLYIITKEDRELSSDELEKKLYDLAKDIEGVEVDVEMSTMDMSALGGSGVSLEIKGRDLDVLYNLANDAAKILKDTEGLTDISCDSYNSDPEFRITINKEKAIEKGLTVAQIFGEIYPALSEAKATTTLSTATDDISVYVEDQKNLDYTRNRIKNFKFAYTDADGKEASVMLKSIADFDDVKGFTTIKRTDQTRYVTVSAEVADGYNIGLVSQDAEKNMESLELPDGYSLEFTGENEMIVDALKQLLLMLVLAVVFIYLIMVAQFQSLGSPFIIMFTIPLAFTGGLAALYFTGFELSIIAMIGFVMLSGVIVNNGIVLVDYINQLRERGMSKKDAIVEAGVTRLRPVLMTALTTILALCTMAFSTKMGADMSRPLAIVVIGGMVYGTLMTLVVVPCIYDMFTSNKVKKTRMHDEEVSDDLTVSLADEPSYAPSKADEKTGDHDSNPYYSIVTDAGKKKRR